MNLQENLQQAKQAAGKAAAQLIQNGMLVGLGTGSTATFFIESLIERCRHDHLKIKAFPTSERSAKHALSGGISLCDENAVTYLDVTVDGADEIDPQKRMIKGGGGALLREKIVANMSREMVVVVDQNKFVTTLGSFPLPLEIAPFAHHATLHQVRKLGYDGNMRLSQEGALWVTENGNYIIDIKFSHPCSSPEKDQALLCTIPGVLETGFFFNLAGRVIIGQFDGTITCLE
jgi:ribose 5-phosphate isomerase A